MILNGVLLVMRLLEDDCKLQYAQTSERCWVSTKEARNKRIAIRADDRTSNIRTQIGTRQLSPMKNCVP